uniref:Uncharacterized protein n=1 Tax=Arion vulgaris TaxID=1028688 RepID=A0A0B7BU96_9EUPU
MLPQQYEELHREFLKSKRGTLMLIAHIRKIDTRDKMTAIENGRQGSYQQVSSTVQ